MRYFFHIGYNGYQYNGWQRLPQAYSVQQVIETQLSENFKTPVNIVGCGRTDTKVHASQYFFHADIPEPWDFDLLFRLNKNLPNDIAVFDIIPVDDHAHARLHAVERSYTYFIHTYKDPYLSTFSAPYLGKKLNLAEMKKAVALLSKYNNYGAFCRNPAIHRTTICTVTAANLYHTEDNRQLRFEITANRFLKGMIRIIMKNLLQIGEGKLSVAEFENRLITHHTDEVTKPAYPQGLYLSRVAYPFLEMPVKSEMFNALVNSNKWKLI